MLQPHKHKSHLLLFAALAGFATVAVLILTLVFTGANMDYWDIGVYHGYANLTFTEHQIPYIDFRIEYPQFSLVTILPPYIPVLLTGNHDLFIPAHIIMFFLIYIGIIIFTFLIAERIYNKTRAWIAVTICILSPALLYYSIFKYDAFPALLLLASVYLFLRESENTYVMTAIGFLTKIFPIIFLPFYIIYDIKKGSFKWKNIGKAIITILVVTIPFILLNPGNFIWTYWTHLNRGIQTESIWFLFHMSGIDIPNLITTFAAPLIIVGLLVMYWKDAEIWNITDMTSYGLSIPVEKKIIAKETAILYATVALYVFVMLNKVASPQYLLWIAPLLAILLSDDILGMTLLMAINIQMFVEYPMSIYTVFSPYDYIDIPQATNFFIIKYILWTALLLLLLRKTSRKYL